MNNQDKITHNAKLLGIGRAENLFYNGFHRIAQEYASERLKDDKEIVIAAFREVGYIDQQLITIMKLQYVTHHSSTSNNHTKMNGLKPATEQALTLHCHPNSDSHKNATDNSARTMEQHKIPKRLRDDKDVVLAAVKQNGHALRYASVRLKSDIDVVVAAIENCGYGLGYVPKTLRKELADDKNIVLAAVVKCGSELKYASKRLRDDIDVVLAAVKESGWALGYSSIRMKDDKDVVLAAVERCGYELQHASRRLRDDIDVVLAAVKHNGDALMYASIRMRDNRDVVLEAVKQDGYALKYASDMVKDDAEVVYTAVKQSSVHTIYSASNRLRDEFNDVLQFLKHEEFAFEYALQRLQELSVLEVNKRKRADQSIIQLKIVSSVIICLVAITLFRGTMNADKLLRMI